MSQERVTKKALLDSGAMESFVHPRLVNELMLNTKNLHKPRQVRNVDGTSNRMGKVMKEVEFQLFHENYCQTRIPLL